MRRVCIICALVFAVLSISACQNQGSSQASTPVVIVLTPEATGVSLPATPSGPTPSADQVGTVTGQLIRLSKGQPSAEPLELRLYLGTIYLAENGKEALVGANRETSPLAITDLQGNFTFTNILPGRYGLMIDTPDGLLLLNEPKSGGDLVVTVKAGEAFQLGRLEYELQF